VAHKNKGRKGDKGKGKKRDLAKDEAPMPTPAAADAAPVQTAAKAEATPRVAPRATRPRPVAAAKVAAPKAAAAHLERPGLPSDRASLIALHQAARRERDAAPLLSRERAEATFEIERIEVQIARVERAMDPPLV
jgi:hypothetical protein